MSKDSLLLIKTKPFFLLFLPIFFIFHGYSSNYDTVPIGPALLLMGEYFLASFILVFTFWLIFRNVSKACFMTFIVMLYYLFFGNVKDFLATLLSQTVLHYRFFLPASLIAFVAIFYW